MKAGGLIREIGRSTPGKLGLILLVILTLASLFVVTTYPANFGSVRWGNPSIWADNPKSVPPAWTNTFSRTKSVIHSVSTLTVPTSIIEGDNAQERRYDFEVELDSDEPPALFSLSISNIAFTSRPPIIAATLLRPDAREIILRREVVRGARRGEAAPYVRHSEEPLRIVMGSEDRAADELIDLFSTRYGIDVERDRVSNDPLAALFGVPLADDGFEMLKGKFQLRVEILVSDPKDTIESVKVVVGGSVFGVMGTDALGRDLAEGLLFGLPVALLIGISTAIVSTLIGMTLGMMSGYYGGAVDVIIQRAADIVANVPLLPLLIFLVFVVGSHLWLILSILVAFSWPGLTIMIRSMVLQLRTGQEVEAAKVLGASPFRIIFRHIFPHAASYILAQLVFFAPSAILAEAGLSFLGLGDPSIPTWGQILENGFRTGAVFLGYWWWVIPPGLMIVVTAVTFMFLALGLEPVVDPRLRGRRLWRS